ncbi:MAG: AAA family ATPase [Rhodopila sp.]
MSDQSVHAQDIRHSVVTGDGNSITATFGDTGVRLPLERRQVPVPDRRRPPRPGELPRELDILLPTAGTLPLLGREAMLEALHAWLDDPADLSVHALIGEAGSGKTRLALELCRQIDPPDGTNAWLGAFVRPSDLRPVVDTLATRAFTWDRPALLVLDYAATAHRELARWLDALVPDRQPHRLRSPMQQIVTLAERKAAEAARHLAAVEALVPVLAAYARAHGGRFLLHGSAARRTMKHDSDVDLLLDFPEATLGEAWNFAETACWDRGLEPDLMPYGLCRRAFLDHIAPDLRVIV